MADLGAAVGAGAIQQLIQDVSNLGFTFLNKWAYEDSYKKLGQWQNDLNIANWKMQNEYNLPENQIKRLEAAGLNPNLMYGQGNVGNAGSLPSAGGSGINPGMKAGRFDLGVLQQVEAAENIQLKNDEQRILNNEQKLKLFDRVREYNAIEQFVADHVEGEYSGPELVGMNMQGELIFLRGDGNDYTQAIRNTPQYKKLEILWKNGEITEQDLDYLKNKVRSSSVEADWSEDIQKLLQGDWSQMSLGEFFGTIMKVVLSKVKAR